MSQFNRSGVVELSRNGTAEGPSSRLNVCVHVSSEVPTRASMEELGVTRHQILRDVSSRSPSGRVVIRPLDEELRSSVLYGSRPEKSSDGILRALSDLVGNVTQGCCARPRCVYRQWCVHVSDRTFYLGYHPPGVACRYPSLEELQDKIMHEHLSLFASTRWFSPCLFATFQLLNANSPTTRACSPVISPC